jgi:AcrR family transcriptional regulator
MRDTRAKIIQAAMELFWLKGFHSTSIADLLSRTQLNSGSLYHFFPSKQDVLVAVLEAYRDGIFALLGAYRRMMLDSDCTYGCPIGSLALELHEPDPDVRELMAANFAAWTAAIERCLKEAGARLPKRLDRKALAEFVLTTMEGGVMQARTHRDIAYFDRAVQSLRAHFRMLEDRARVRA